jgi:hypothetical protein
MMSKIWVEKLSLVKGSADFSAKRSDSKEISVLVTLAPLASAAIDGNAVPHASSTTWSCP